MSKKPKEIWITLEHLVNDVASSALVYFAEPTHGAIKHLVTHYREVTQQSEVDSLVLKEVRRLLMEMKNNGTKASDRFWEQINLCLDVIDGRPEGSRDE